MDQQHALKNLIENGTNIEYFDNRYYLKKEKRILKKQFQTQQNKLLLQARGGGLEPKKKKFKNKLKKQINDRNYEDVISYEQQEDQNESEEISIREVSNKVAAEGKEKSLKKRVRKRVVETFKASQINYSNPQLVFEELNRLRTENSFIKQQHLDAIKQIEKYKQKLNDICSQIDY